MQSEQTKSDTEHFTLSDLVFPITSRKFIAEHWNTGQPFVGKASEAILHWFRSDPGFASVEALLPKLQDDVTLLGPNQFRAPVAPAVAIDFLNNGYNIYITRIERALPEARELFREVARDLGVPPWYVHVEAFAGCAGGLSSRHFDHDINFQVLLEGEKTWKLAPNENIKNPLLPYHPTRARNGSISSFAEEAHAHNREVPNGFTDTVTELRVCAGAVVFLPRAYWHEVHSHSRTWSVNLVIKGSTWSQAIGNALIARLHRLPEFRAYYSGLGLRAAPAETHFENVAIETFDRLKTAALEALSAITPVEASLSGNASRYWWTDEGHNSEIVLKDGSHFLVAPGVLEQPLELESAVISMLRSLLLFRGSFSWADVQAVNPEANPMDLHDLLDDLIELTLIGTEKRTR